MEPPWIDIVSDAYYREVCTSDDDWFDGEDWIDGDGDEESVDGIHFRQRIYSIGSSWGWGPEQVLRRIEINDPCLVTLNICGYRQDEEVGCEDGHRSRLGVAIGNNTKLKTLFFSANGSGSFLNDQKEKREELFRGVALNRSIKELGFEHFRHVDGDVFFFLNPFFESNGNLLRLWLQHCDLSRKGKRLFSLALAKSCSLKHFKYSGGDFEDDNFPHRRFDHNEAERLVLAVSEHPRLRTITLKNCPVIAAGGNAAILASLVSPHRGRLASLDLSGTEMGDGTASALAGALRGSDALSRLVLDDNPGVGIRGWREIFGVLEGGRPAIAHLSLQGNVDPDGAIPGMTDGHAFAACLASSLTDNSALRTLNLSFNDGIPVSGWVALSAILRNTNSVLKTIIVDSYEESTIGSRVLVPFASSLAVNENLKELRVCYARQQDEGWEAISRSLCNASTIVDTFISNHTLNRLFIDQCANENLPDDLRDFLDWNTFVKFDAASLKIMKCHFSGNYGMHHFVGMDVGVFPHVIAWMGRVRTKDTNGVEIGGVPLLYRFVRNMHHLLNFTQSDTSKNSRRRKRSRPK